MRRRQPDYIDPLEQQTYRRQRRLALLLVLLILLIAYYAWLEPYGTLPRLWYALEGRFAH